jgi:hypothetical protein
MSTVVIPAELVDLLRDGLRGRLAVAAQQIANADGRVDAREHPERYRDPLLRIDALRALLEEIGWDTPPGNLRIDLQTHGWALIESLGDEIDFYADTLREIDQDDEQHEAATRNMGALTALALTVMLRIQAQILRNAQPRRRRAPATPTPASCSAPAIRDSRSG